MQPGGKIQDGETPREALARELEEELGCALLGAEFLGTFFAPAANEPLRSVQAALFVATVAGDIEPAAEIQEIAWIEPWRTGDVPLAPLTRDHVLPLARSRAGGPGGP
jgi:8-oxo-dGTP diphosphatase